MVFENCITQARCGKTKGSVARLSQGGSAIETQSRRAGGVFQRIPRATLSGGAALLSQEGVAHQGSRFWSLLVRAKGGAR